MPVKIKIILGVILTLGLAGVSLLGLFSSEKEVSMDFQKNHSATEEDSLVEENEKSFLEGKEGLSGSEDDPKKDAFEEQNFSDVPKEDKKSDETEKTDERKGENEKINIKNNLVTWGFSAASSRSIDTIVIHSSYNALGGDEYDFGKLLSEYKEYGVAPHYLIDRKGVVYRLVEDKNIAWHAGESKTPDGRKNVNDFSVGIELMNTKTDKYTLAQYESLSELLSYLKGKYKIKYTLGHKDIAPGRKDDPWNFEWEKVK